MREQNQNISFVAQLLYIKYPIGFPDTVILSNHLMECVGEHDTTWSD